MASSNDDLTTINNECSITVPLELQQTALFLIEISPPGCLTLIVEDLSCLFSNYLKHANDSSTSAGVGNAAYSFCVRLAVKHAEKNYATVMSLITSRHSIKLISPEKRILEDGNSWYLDIDKLSLFRVDLLERRIVEEQSLGELLVSASEVTAAALRLDMNLLKESLRSALELHLRESYIKKMYYNKKTAVRVWWLCNEKDDDTCPTDYKESKTDETSSNESVVQQEHEYSAFNLLLKKRMVLCIAIVAEHIDDREFWSARWTSEWKLYFPSVEDQESVQFQGNLSLNLSSFDDEKISLVQHRVYSNQIPTNSFTKKTNEVAQILGSIMKDAESEMLNQRFASFQSLMETKCTNYLHRVLPLSGIGFDWSTTSFTFPSNLY